MPRTFAEYLVSLDACREAVEWVGDRDLATAWAECERADWMLWLLAIQIGKRGWPSHRDVVRLTCDCAARALRFVPVGEDRPRLAIEAARRWADEPTEENCEAACAAADAARAAVNAGRVTDCAAADVAFAAAYAAVNAAAYAAVKAARAAAEAGSAAAYAAAEAGSAAAYAAAYAPVYAAAVIAEHRAMCDLIRRVVPRLPDWKEE